MVSPEWNPAFFMVNISKCNSLDRFCVQTTHTLCAIFILWRNIIILQIRSIDVTKQNGVGSVGTLHITIECIGRVASSYLTINNFLYKIKITG